MLQTAAKGKNGEGGQSRDSRGQQGLRRWEFMFAGEAIRWICANV